MLAVVRSRSHLLATLHISPFNHTFQPFSEGVMKNSQTVVLKLNGGLGTGMGLEKAKSLLQVGGPRTARSHLHKFMDGSDVPAARDQREG